MKNHRNRFWAILPLIALSTEGSWGLSQKTEDYQVVRLGLAKESVAAELTGPAFLGRAPEYKVETKLIGDYSLPRRGEATEFKLCQERDLSGCRELRTAPHIPSSLGGGRDLDGDFRRPDATTTETAISSATVYGDCECDGGWRAGCEIDAASDVLTCKLPRDWEVEKLSPSFQIVAQTDYRYQISPVLIPAKLGAVGVAGILGALWRNSATDPVVTPPGGDDSGECPSPLSSDCDIVKSPESEKAFEGAASEVKYGDQGLSGSGDCELRIGAGKSSGWLFLLLPLFLLMLCKGAYEKKRN